MDVVEQRMCADRAYDAVAELRREQLGFAVPALIGALAIPVIVSAIAGGAIPWWSLAIVAAAIAAYALAVVQLRWAAWHRVGIFPGDGNRGRRSTSWTPALIVTAVALLGGAFISPLFGVAVSTTILLRRTMRRSRPRPSPAWPKHDPKARPSGIMSESPTLDVVTAFACVDHVRPTIVARLLGLDATAMEATVTQLRKYRYLEVGRFDGVETTLGLTPLGAETYAEHLRAIAPHDANAR